MRCSGNPEGQFVKAQTKPVFFQCDTALFDKTALNSVCRCWLGFKECFSALHTHRLKDLARNVTRWILKERFHCRSSDHAISSFAGSGVACTREIKIDRNASCWHLSIIHMGPSTLHTKKAWREGQREGLRGGLEGASRDGFKGGLQGGLQGRLQRRGLKGGLRGLKGRLKTMLKGGFKGKLKGGA